MKLASYIDRNSAHEALYKSVSRGGRIYQGVLVRPNLLVSLNVNDPDVVATTEKDSLERLLWVKLNSEDDIPEGFVEVKWDDADNSIRGFFYDEYDEFDETTTGVKKFHGLLRSGSDVTIDADDVWVRPWAEADSFADKGQVYNIQYSNRWAVERATGFFTWDSANSLFRELKAGGCFLNSSHIDIHDITRVPLVGDVVGANHPYTRAGSGAQLQCVYRGSYVVTEVPPEVTEALRWL